MQRSIGSTLLHYLNNIFLILIVICISSFLHNLLLQSLGYLDKHEIAGNSDVLTAMVILFGLLFALRLGVSFIHLKYYGFKMAFGKTIKAISIIILLLAGLATYSASLQNKVGSALTNSAVSNKVKNKATNSISVSHSVSKSNSYENTEVTLAFMESVASRLEDSIIKSQKEQFVAKGFSLEYLPVITSTYTTLNASQCKLGVVTSLVKGKTSDGAMNGKIITIIGIKGKEMHRVSCNRLDDVDFRITTGKCFIKLKEVFGTLL